MKVYHATINIIVVADNEKEARDILLKQMQKFTDKIMRKTAVRGFLEEKNMKDLYYLRLVQKCAAEDCQRYFVPTPRGRNQEYCSRQCYERIYSRRRYLREKKK